MLEPLPCRLSTVRPAFGGEVLYDMGRFMTLPLLFLSQLLITWSDYVGIVADQTPLPDTMSRVIRRKPEGGDPERGTNDALGFEDIACRRFFLRDVVRV